MDKMREILIMVAVFYCALIFVGCALFVSAHEEKLLIVGKEEKKTCLGISSRSTKKEELKEPDVGKNDAEDDVNKNQ